MLQFQLDSRLLSNWVIQHMVNPDDMELNSFTLSSTDDVVFGPSFEGSSKGPCCCTSVWHLGLERDCPVTLGNQSGDRCSLTIEDITSDHQTQYLAVKKPCAMLACKS